MTSTRHFSDDRGFTLVAVIISMMVMSLFAVVAWGAAANDLPLVRKDTDRKRALEAAEAGLQWYTSVLQRDSNAWAKCATNGSSTNPVNMMGSRANWGAVNAGTDRETDASFAVELVPQDPSKSCTTSPGDAMLGSSGQLKVRVTGRANGKQRQLQATFRHKGFLDFIYFTQWETLAPGVASYAGSSQTPAWVMANCDKPRSSPTSGGARSSSCTGIQFADTDAVDGPLHTEDSSLLICGTPTFGRNAADNIEVTRGTAGAWTVASGSCANNPDRKGTLYAPAGSLVPPADNRAMKAVATVSLSGNTCLTFNGTTVTIDPDQVWTGGKVTCATTSASTTTTLSADNVFYVDNDGSCTVEYDYQVNYDTEGGCGTVAVKGTYSSNITIGAARDIIVTGNLTPTSASSALAGLVASRFVRVYHPVTGRSGTGSSQTCSNASGFTPVTEIDAAILATSRSFIADNWYCGNSLGTLKINGAIAQYWRGPVGKSSGSGYIKDYNYDDRLRYSQPPNFLDPVGSAWRLVRRSEQAPVQ